MNPIVINKTEDSPEIKFDPANNIFEINGRSLMEDVTEFYSPVLEWIKAYGESPNEQTTIRIQLDYYNTASSKMLMDVMFAFEEIAEAGKAVSVLWVCNEEDSDMLDAGEEWAELLDIPVEIKTF